MNDNPAPPLKREEYSVSIVRPIGMTVSQVKEYIETAVSSWAGGGNPDDPVFNIADYGVIVKKIIK